MQQTPFEDQEEQKRQGGEARNPAFCMHNIRPTDLMLFSRAVNGNAISWHWTVLSFRF
jgi:hypothetical protein